VSFRPRPPQEWRILRKLGKARVDASPVNEPDDRLLYPVSSRRCANVSGNDGQDVCGWNRPLLAKDKMANRKIRQGSGGTQIQYINSHGQLFSLADGTGRRLPTLAADRVRRRLSPAVRGAFHHAARRDVVLRLQSFGLSIERPLSASPKRSALRHATIAEEFSSADLTPPVAVEVRPRAPGALRDMTLIPAATFAAVARTAISARGD
jgi:hypothetical protein